MSDVGGLPEITAREAMDRLSSADVVLLDVRERDEWQAGHSGDAVHIPLSELEVRVGEVSTDHTVAVICRSGARSARATGFLLASGVAAVNVVGGMNAWATAGGSMTSETDAAPQVI